MNRHERRATRASARQQARTLGKADPLDVAGRAAALSRANERMFREMRGLRAAVDAKQADSPLRAEVQCRRGCAACCRQIVLGELAEAEMIVARYPQTVARLLPLIVEQNERIERTISGDEINEMWRAGNARSTASDKYWDMNMPCAFLTKDNQCAVYDERPNACRTHFVSSPPADCSVGNEGVITILDMGTRSALPVLSGQLIDKYRKTAVLGMLPQLVLQAAVGQGGEAHDLRTGERFTGAL